MPLQQVQDGIKSGAIATRHELGFTLVDVAPGSTHVQSPKRDKSLRPNTFTIVANWPEADGESQPAAKSTAKPAAQPVRARRREVPPPPVAIMVNADPRPDADIEPSFDGGDESVGSLNEEISWREARALASAMRRRPAATAA